LGRTHQPLVPHKLGSSWTWTKWIKGFPSCSLNVPSPSRSILLHMFWTNSFNAYLSFFALALVIGPIGTSNGSLAWLRLVLGWSASIVVFVSFLIWGFLFVNVIMSFYCFVEELYALIIFFNYVYYFLLDIMYSIKKTSSSLTRALVLHQVVVSMIMSWI